MMLSFLKLVLEITEGIERVRRIKLLIILAVTAFNFSVVSGRKGFNQLMLNAQFTKCFLEQSLLFCSSGAKPICEFKSIVSLDAFNDIRKRLDYVLDELGR